MSEKAVAPLLLYDFVIAASIFDENGRKLAKVTRTPEHFLTDWLTRLFVKPFEDYSMRLVEPTSHMFVGTLKVTSHTATMLRDFYGRAARMVVGGVLRNLLLAIILLYVFQRLLTRPIRALAQRLRAVDPRNPAPFEVPENIRTANNELTTLAETTNGILTASRTHLHELGEAQRRAEDVTGQLRHSERLSAIGQLAGGVAHDFNNILSVIMGSLDLIDDATITPEQHDFLSTARQATSRGATLTAQLLASSRNNPLDPTAIDSKVLFKTIQNMLSRTLGEQYETKFIVSGDQWLCFADVHQLETVLINLILNARDAMPGGGKLTVEALNTQLSVAYCAQEKDVWPGQYVCFAVTDNGTGIPKDILTHVFEPYYTTKPVGKGSGLGLAMAYGFAKQSKGHIRICSEEGRGTTVKLYLPRSVQDAVASGPGHSAALDLSTIKGRHLLVVEDDPLLCKIICAYLIELGLEVISAQTPEQGLAMATSADRLDGALLDVILPGAMSGRELGDEIMQKRPECRVMYMSGYTAGAIAHESRPEPDVILLKKPFTLPDLALALSRLFELA